MSPQIGISWPARNDDERKKETMSEEEKQFEPGEIVRLKSGGPMMTIGTPSEASSSCYWFDGVKAKALGFPTSTLRRVDADEIEAERTVLFAAADKVKADGERFKILFEKLQSDVIPTVVEYAKERATAERLKGEPLQLANAFRDAFLGLGEEQRNALMQNVWAHDPDAGKKFFEAMLGADES